MKEDMVSTLEQIFRMSNLDQEGIDLLFNKYDTECTGLISFDNFCDNFLPLDNKVCAVIEEN